MPANISTYTVLHPRMRRNAWLISRKDKSIFAPFSKHPTHCKCQGFLVSLIKPLGQNTLMIRTETHTDGTPSKMTDSKGDRSKKCYYCKKTPGHLMHQCFVDRKRERESQGQNRPPSARKVVSNINLNILASNSSLSNSLSRSEARGTSIHDSPSSRSISRYCTCKYETWTVLVHLASYCLSQKKKISSK